MLYIENVHKSSRWTRMFCLCGTCTCSVSNQKVILTKHNIFIQRGLKISSKTMKDRITGHSETQTLVSVVVHIWEENKATVVRGLLQSCRWVAFDVHLHNWAFLPVVGCTKVKQGLGSESWWKLWSLTTYGVSKWHSGSLSRSRQLRTSLYSFEEDRGAKNEVYEQGILTPSSVKQTKNKM